MTDVPTERVMEAVLDPCPFCGNTNPFLEGPPKARHVTCNNDLCQASIMPEATDAKAIAAWNRRAPSSELLALREAVKPFARIANLPGMDELFSDDYQPMGLDILPFLSDYRRAARTLQSHSTGDDK